MTDDKTPCDDTGHDQHLCALATQSVRPLDPEDPPSMAEMKAMADELRALSRDPRFRCDLCGRAAANRRNLCRPVQLRANAECSSAAHDQHLCQMVAQAVLRNEPLAQCNGWPIPQGREALVRNPRFKCRTCGRGARGQKNLCDPKEISAT